ncbi:MAG: hypothetical protein AAGF84_11565 [Planctomycetota bacterium]
MAKKSPTGNATKLNALIKKAKSAAKAFEAPDPRDPAHQLAVALLQFNHTRKAAEDAHAALLEAFVDLHELRVSHPHEIVDVIGEDYPAAYERAIRLREALNAVYAREHDVTLKTVATKGKREQRSYLDTLPATPPYAAASVALLSFGAHAFPVDDKLCALLIAEGVMEDDARPADGESFIIKTLKAGEALEAHVAIQAWADKRKAPAITKKPAAAPKKKAASKKSTAKTTKTTKASKTTKKVAKKTTKKKVARTAKKK